MTTVIYGLIDPRIMEVRYVGKTSETVARRLRGHYRDAYSKGPSPVRAWLLKLEKLGLKPLWTILEEDPADWREAERRWIAYYRALYPGKMKNLADGGQGGNPTLSGAIRDPNHRRGPGFGSKYQPWTEEARAANGARQRALCAKIRAQIAEANAVQAARVVV